MTTPLSEKRCSNHAGREAAARCPACRQFFCRECVVEHGGRLLCAACITRLERRGAAGGRRAGGLFPLLAALAGLMMLWLVFFGVGYGLHALPHTFHEDAADTGGEAE